MKKMIALALFGAATVVAAPTFAQATAQAPAKAAAPATAAAPAAAAPAAAPNAQQERMKDCNAKAADKKGDERKAFMSTCLKG
jgi:hypothetical protein